MIVSQCDQCSTGETREKHGRRIGGVVTEGFLEKETIEQSFEDKDALYKKEEKRVMLGCRWLNLNPNSPAYELCGFWLWARDSASLKFSFYICKMDPILVFIS